MVRTLSAVTALAVTAVVVLIRRDRRRLRREAVAERLMAGCAHRDNAALAAELQAFRRRMEPVLARQQVVAEAGLVVDEALSAHNPESPPMEGGPR